MAGEWLIATANANMFTYEIAPVFILMESFVLQRMREIIGFPQGDSIFAPGRLNGHNINCMCMTETVCDSRRDNFESVCAHCGAPQNVPGIQDQWTLELSEKPHSIHF